MRKAVSLLSLLLFFTCNCFAQAKRVPNAFAIGSTLIEQNKYLKAVDTVRQLQIDYNQSHHIASGSPNTSATDQALSLFQSFIGEDYPIRWKEREKYKNYPEGSTHFSQALPYIAGKAKTRQVVMINENHRMAQTRLLTYNLLDTLYKLGYRYLAVEALAPNNPSAPLNLKYPSYYTQEPNMGNLLKRAIRLGYKLVAYESQDTTSYDEKNPHYASNLRELHQARNLYQILVKDPKAKMIVHCGHGHVFEYNSGDDIMMAEYFRIISGIDPLTINQSIDHENEFANDLEKSPQYTAKGTPYVVLDEKGAPRTSAYQSTIDYDLLVTWPISKTLYGRKDYMLKAKTGTKLYKFDVKPQYTGNLIQIKSTDVNDDIPVDQFIAKTGVIHYATSLEPGRYLLQAMNYNGDVLWRKEINIK